MTTKTMHIGLDDTDSTRKGCTTYVAALLVEKLQRLGADFIDYPNLIRLNPNVPWKTRGNGALCLRIEHDENIEREIKETVAETVEQNADLEFRGTDPGIVFFTGTRVPKEVKEFARNSITKVVTLKQAKKVLAKFHFEAIAFKNGRGIIGGLAAIGETLESDHTYEILAYRLSENCGSKRQVDEASIFEMNRATAPYTFNNVDLEKRRVIITPRGPDPILFGIRGENPRIVKQAFSMVKSFEPVERWVIFRTNQGTDAHLKKVERLSQAEPYTSVIVEGSVATTPRIVPRRHVIFSMRDESAEIDCAAYEPTGALRRVARNLIVGDSIEAFGAVRHATQNRPLTINLEKIRLLKLMPKIVYRNPLCPKCGKRLESMGRNQGFRCGSCGLRTTSLKKLEVNVKREVRPGIYVTSARSQRHLTKPLTRYGTEKRHERFEGLIDSWHFP